MAGIYKLYAIRFDPNRNNLQRNIEVYKMTKNVLIFISEVLAMHTIMPIMKYLKGDPRIKMTIIHDGFCTEEVNKHNIDYTLIKEPFLQNVEQFVRESDLVLSGKSYSQLSEIELINIAKGLQIPYLLLVPDIGGEIALAKLTDRRNKRLLLPDKIFIADKKTHDYLINFGVPENLIIAAGSPYFDMIYNRSENEKRRPNKNLLVYISTPFELDHKRGILDAPYEQHQLIQDIKTAAQELNLDLVAKRHTQLDPELFNGINTYDGDIFSLLMQAHVVVGSYSTGLLEASVIGTPVVSYQPWRKNIREDVFFGRIPIAKSYKELVDNISKAPLLNRNSLDKMIYNPGKSLSIILNHIYTTLSLNKTSELSR